MLEMKDYNCLNSQMIKYIDYPKKSTIYLPELISKFSSHSIQSQKIKINCISIY